MSDLIVKAVNLSKVYRLYAKPHHRFLDMFGLLGQKEGAYTEHRALDRVNLEIRKGERVAFIGRNGAGKSTLLKLATKVIEPTSGTIDVAEGANALLQIGAGFHHDFTGRENAVSYLAHLGITGKEAINQVEEIIEFAELEEYIDQPIKTYSTGMVARLMFAVSTSINPKLLVLDEILGVGDAYFAQKSQARLQELCEKNETTVLLVSHDIYAAARLCNRMIWIDKGRVIIDGISSTVMKAYEDSIRAQEEARLRQKKFRYLETSLNQTPENNLEHVRIEFFSKNNMPLNGIVYFSRITLKKHDGTTLELPLTSGHQDSHAPHLDLNDGCWGSPTDWNGRHSRPMLNHGSPFHSVSGSFVGSKLGSLDLLSHFEVEYWMEADSDLLLRVFVNQESVDLGPLPTVAGAWNSHTAKIPSSSTLAPQNEINLAGIHGTGDITIIDILTLNELGQESFHFRHGEAVTIAIKFHIKRKDLCERVQILVAFLRDGVQDVCRVIDRDLIFDHTEHPIGTVFMHWNRMPLAPGSYAVSAIIAKEGYYDRPQSVFYSINPEVYSCISRGTEIIVQDGGAVASGTAVVETADWAIGDARAKPHAPKPQSANSGTQSTIKIDFPDCVSRQFPAEFPLAWDVTQEILEKIKGKEYSRLAIHSPGLAGFDWGTYLKLSVIRMTHALRALRTNVPERGSVLDFGSYFGNFSLMACAAKYEVFAADSYTKYGNELAPIMELLRDRGASIWDLPDNATAHPTGKKFDAVLLMGVIEHIPHSPRLLLEMINGLLKPDGVLILDTPNLAYIYNRQKLMIGESVFCPIESQFWTAYPFEGHHREYTAGELDWMLKAIGHKIVESTSFNYSMLGAGTLTGRDAENYLQMQNDPLMREVLFTVSKPLKEDDALKP
jgi:ABC-type polysaccharide/polyol phosphate transport system ATPase subunit/SAM-dependent methyltransferase